MTNEFRLRSEKPVAAWLLVGVGMIIIQILLGGITRLTGSGLSITEWDVITGTLPPLNAHQWEIEFEKYRQTPQFQLLNFDFTLHDFKFIFFWEWLHRFWARLIGIVFAIPFLIFLFQRRFKPAMVTPLIILFLLGALQGAVGWIMVASGLTGDAIYVKPAKLAIHFILALGLLCYTFWFALQLLVREDKLVINSSLKKLATIILVVLTIQLVYGALMAGFKSAIAAPTWPDINGAFIPEYIFHSKERGWDLVENRITIQFIHRTLAYILFLLVVIWTVKAYKTKASVLFEKTRWIPAFIITIQVVLGILTLFSSIKIVPNQWGLFEWMAQLHQLTAILFLLSVVWMLFLIRKSHASHKE